MMPSTKLMVPDQLSDTDPQKKLIIEFVNEYENVKKYGKVSTHSGYAWDAITLVVNAMKKSGSTCRLKCVMQLRIQRILSA